MKPFKRVEYIRPVEYILLSSEEKLAYDNEVIDLRKKLRALVAYQDSSDCVYNEDKITFNSLYRKYGLENERSESTAMIMRMFVRDRMYYQKISPLYEEKDIYDSGDNYYRSTHKKVYSPIDYFDIPTLYHYYKFRNKIIKKHKADTIERKQYTRTPDGFSRLVHDCAEEYLETPSVENMYFDRSDIKLTNIPLKGYVNIGNIQNRFDRDIMNDQGLDFAEKEGFKDMMVIDAIKGEIVSYMVSYFEKTNKSANKAQLMANIISKFSITAIEQIKARCYESKTEEYLIDRYSLGLNAEDIVNIQPRKKDLNTRPSTEDYPPHNEFSGFIDNGQYMFFPKPKEDQSYGRKR